MGKGGTSQENKGGGEWGGVQYAPIQIGAKSPVQSLGGKQYNELINGIYSYIKAYVIKSADIFKPEEAAGKAKAISDNMSKYEDRAAQIADTLLTSFATAIQPDEMKTFPLDSFVQSSLKEIYSKAKGIFDKPIMDRNEIKAIVDANAGNLASSFREQRRGIEQEIQARGLSGPAAAAARDEIERGIASGRDDIMRSVLGTQTANKYNTQLSALGTMQGATAQAEQVSTDYANRWLNQWGQKLNAQNLMLQGQVSALGANAQASDIAGQQYQVKWNEMNYPLNVLTTSAMPYLNMIGQQDISAHSGAGTSWGSQWSTGSSSGPSGSFGLPFGIWNQTY